MNNLAFRSQSGFVLIAGLVFITIITVVTVATMQSSNMDYQISTNEIFKDIAFQNSESGKSSVGEGISHFVYHREWLGFESNGLTHFATNYDPLKDKIGTDENIYDSSTLTPDMEYVVTGTDIVRIEADINIIKSPAIRSQGSGLQQLSGYEGLGKGAGASGVYLIYEFRSEGGGAADAVATTASEYKVIP